MFILRMPSTAAVGCFLLLWALDSGTASDDLTVVTAHPGDDVILPCQANDSSIRAVEWTRPDLKPDIVLYYSDGHLDPTYQHPSFKDRVDLVDRELKAGNVSLILKNVSSIDNGTYECRVKPDSSRRKKRASIDSEPIRIIRLQVPEPAGHTAGDEGDKNGGDKDGGNINRHYGLIAAGLFVVITVLVCILWVHKRPQNNNSADEETGPQQDKLLDQRPLNNNFTDDKAGPQQETPMDILDQRSMNHNSVQPAADEAGLQV